MANKSPSKSFSFPPGSTSASARTQRDPARVTRRIAALQAEVTRLQTQLDERDAEYAAANANCTEKRRRIEALEASEAKFRREAESSKSYTDMLSRDLDASSKRVSALITDLGSVLEKSAMAWTHVVESKFASGSADHEARILNAKQCLDDAFGGISKETREAIASVAQRNRMLTLIAATVPFTVGLWAAFAKVTSK